MRPYRLLLLLSLCFATVINAAAQNDTLYNALNEVTVVGVKQNSLTDLSVSTVIMPAELRRQNVVAMKNISGLVPNFFMPDYGSRMTSSIYVRGLGARIDQPVVGLSVDGVPYLNKDNYDFDLFDINRIDVFRGAQSILNGRNTMAGQVNITTLSPRTYQGLRAMAEYGRANTFKVGAGYYARVNGNMYSAVTGYFTGTDGFFRNEYTGNLIDGARQGSLRWKLVWQPSRRLSVTNSLSGQLSRQGGYPYENLATGLIAHNDTCFYKRATFADGLTVGWTGQRVLVTSVTSVQYLDDNMTLDQDFTPERYFTMSQIRKEWAFTEDLYCKGRRVDLDWIGGVFAFFKRMNMRAPVTFHADGINNLIVKKPNEINPTYPIAWDDDSFVLGSDFIGETKGVAVYGQGAYKKGSWTFEAGARIDIECATLSYRSHCNTSYTTYHVNPDGSREVFRHNPLDIDEGDRLRHTYVQFMPKIAIGYELAGGTRIFANVAKGYKSGGFNTQMFSDVLQQRIMEMMGITKLYEIDDIVSYKPEKSWNFEIGAKAVLHNVDVDATLFYISCIDQQLTAFPPGLTTGRIMTNAGRTRSYGVELTAAWHPAEVLTLRGSYGYTNARFVKYDNGRENYAGKRLPYAPANTLFVSANYELPRIMKCVPSFNISARGIGDIYWDDANLVKQPFYATLGASAALDFDHFNIRFWGENITSTRYSTFYFVSVGNAFVQRACPATYGVTLRVNI